MGELESVLQEKFGHASFRPGQKPLIEAALKGQDCIGIFPTGAGKSLCYAMAGDALYRTRQGITLVISPLIALMNDQRRRFEQFFGSSAVASLHSGMSAQEQGQCWQTIESGSVRFLFLAPERVLNPNMLQRLSQLNIALVVVDEAHCIEMWGAAFRPEYAQLGSLRQHISLSAQWMALTATAPASTVDKIVRNLGMHQPVVVRTPMHRPNLRYRVQPVILSEAMPALIEQLKPYRSRQGTPPRVIIYRRSRQGCESIAHILQKGGWAASAYHAGMDNRPDIERAFMARRLQILVCTNAFGMGVDIPDIRAVIHVGAPPHIESYVQEAGRAGRDGAPADCILLASPHARKVEASTLSYLALQTGADSGSEHGTCRQLWFENYFGFQHVQHPGYTLVQEHHHTAPCQRCDLCRGQEPDWDLITSSKRSTRSNTRYSRRSARSTTQSRSTTNTGARRASSPRFQKATKPSEQRPTQSQTYQWPRKAHPPAQSAQRQRTLTSAPHLAQRLSQLREQLAKRDGCKAKDIWSSTLTKKLSQNPPRRLRELVDIGLDEALVYRWGAEILDVLSRFRPTETS